MGTGSPVPFVDPRTIVLLTGVMGGLMAVVLYFLQRNYPPSVKGLRYWTAGTAVLFAAGLTAATRGLTPDVVSIMLANLLIFTGVYLQFFGTEKFFERKTRFWPRYAMICALTLVSGWFTVVNPLYMPRLMISIIVMSALFSAHAWLILRHGGRSFAYRFAVLILVCAFPILSTGLPSLMD